MQAAAGKKAEGAPAAAAAVVTTAPVKPKQPSSAAQQQAQKPQPPPSPAALLEAWQKATVAQKKGDVVEAKVIGITEAGLVVQMRPLKGFIPFKNLDAERVKAATAAGGPTSFVGQTIKSKIVSADMSRKELILSEKRLQASEALAKVSAGDVLSGVVISMEDYGAFVSVRELPGDVVGLVYKNELSWEKIMTVDEVLQKGQEVRAKVLSADPATCRLALSLKAMTPDPLRGSMDSLAWAAAANADGSSPRPEVQRLVADLAGSIGVTAVSVSREASDPHRVAMELEVYLVRTEGEGEFTAVAIIGSSATEMRISTSLSREQLKQLLQRVARQ